MAPFFHFLQKIPNQIYPKEQQEIAQEKEEAEGGKEEEEGEAPPAREGGLLVAEDGGKQVGIIIEDGRPQEGEQRVVAHHPRKVKGEQGVRRAGHAAGGAIEAEQMQGTEENAVEEVGAVEEKEEERPAQKDGVHGKKAAEPPALGHTRSPLAIPSFLCYTYYTNQAPCRQDGRTEEV